MTFSGKLFAALLACLFTAVSRADVAGIVLVSPGAVSSSLAELIPRFEQSSGYKVTVRYAPALALADRVAGGDAADVAILGEPAADKLAQAGRLAAGSKVKAKTKLTAPSRPLADFVVTGGADFGLTQVTEILADPRLELLGPLPAPVQYYTRYAPSLVANSESQDAGKALIAFLASPGAAAVMRTKGFEPLP